MMAVLTFMRYMLGKFLHVRINEHCVLHYMNYMCIKDSCYYVLKVFVLVAIQSHLLFELYCMEFHVVN